MNQDSTEVEDAKPHASSASRARWWIFIGLLIYLLFTWKNSLLGLIVGFIGNDGGGSLVIQQRIVLFVVGANLPLTVASLVLTGIGLRWPPLKIRLVLCLFGGAFACILLGTLLDSLFDLGIY